MNAQIDIPVPPAIVPRRDIGLRVQAWLRDRQGLSFDRMQAAPIPALVGGGACRAWRYSRSTWAWWGYVGACAMTFATLAAGVAMRRLEPSTYLALTSFAWVSVAIAAVAWAVAWQSSRRDRYVIAVAWDAGLRPLTTREYRSVTVALQARWPDARECWLLTLHGRGDEHTPTGLRVISLEEKDLPRLSAGARPPDDESDQRAPSPRSPTAASRPNSPLDAPQRGQHLAGIPKAAAGLRIDRALDQLEKTGR